jgi:hypothetical protein
MVNPSSARFAPAPPKAKSPKAFPSLACVGLAAHLGLRDVVAPQARSAHAQSNAGLLARASGNASVGNFRCARIATTTLPSEISATIARHAGTPRPQASERALPERQWRRMPGARAAEGERTEATRQRGSFVHVDAGPQSPKAAEHRAPRALGRRQLARIHFLVTFR